MKNNKLINTLAILAILYGAFSMVYINVNPKYWGQDARVVFTLIAFLSVFAVYTFPNQQK